MRYMRQPLMSCAAAEASKSAASDAFLRRYSMTSPGANRRLFLRVERSSLSWRASARRFTLASAIPRMCATWRAENEGLIGKDPSPAAGVKRRCRC